MRGNSPSGNAPWLTTLHDKPTQHGLPPRVHDSPEARQRLLLQMPVREPGTSTQSLPGQHPPRLHLPPGRMHFVTGTDAKAAESKATKTNRLWETITSNLQDDGRGMELKYGVVYYLGYNDCLYSSRNFLPHPTLVKVESNSPSAQLHTAIQFSRINRTWKYQMLEYLLASAVRNPLTYS